MELNPVINHSNIQKVEVEIFDVAFNIIGGGEEGEKVTVRSKEEADHSLPYIISAALLDGEVTPAQYLQERIRKKDIQGMLRKVEICSTEEFSNRFPAEMPVRIRIKLKSGLVLTKEKKDYEGFFTHPMQWETVVAKFEELSLAHLSKARQEEIEDAVLHLEDLRVRELMALLEKVK